MTSLNLGQQTTELGIELGTVWCQTPVHSQFLIFITLLLKDWFWELLSTNAIAIWNHRKPWLSVLETYHMHVGWSVFLFFSMYFLIFFSALKKICFFLWLLFCYVWMKRTYRQKKKKKINSLQRARADCFWESWKLFAYWLALCGSACLTVLFLGLSHYMNYLLTY